MKEYLTRSDIRFNVRLKAGSKEQAESMHEEIVKDLIEMLNQKFDKEDESWEFDDSSTFVLITKLPERK